MGKHQITILKELSKFGEFSINVEQLKKKLKLSPSYVYRTCFVFWKRGFVSLEPGGWVYISDKGRAEIDKIRKNQ